MIHSQNTSAVQVGRKRKPGETDNTRRPDARPSPGRTRKEPRTAVMNDSDQGIPEIDSELLRDLQREEILGKLEALYDLWCAPPSDPLQRLERAFERFGLDPGSPVSPPELLSKRKDEIKNTLILQKKMKQLDMCSLARDHLRNSMKLNEVTRTIHSASMVLYFLCCTPSGHKQTPQEIWLYSLSTNCPSRRLNEETQVHFFLLQQLEMGRHRRFRGKVYEPVYVADPSTGETRFTHAWKQTGDLLGFIKDTIRPETQFDMWQLLNKGGQLRNAIKRLESSDSFEKLEPHRSVFSFQNGIFHAGKPRFFRYGARQIPQDLCACNFFDAAFPEEYMDAEDWYGGIPAPTLQTILDAQFGCEDEKDEICRWLLAFIGRMLYDVGTYDCWEVMPFIQGVGNSGKSTLAWLIKQFYPADDVGVLSSAAQPQFGLGHLAEKLVVICQEVGKGFKIPQTELQTLISGEMMACARKHRDPVTVDRWRAPVFFSGNEFPQWTDILDNMTRRVMLWKFNNKVISRDPQLKEKLMEELPVILIKVNRAYREFAAKGDLWTGDLPNYFKESNGYLRTILNPFQRFLMDQDECEIDPGRSVAVMDLQSRFIRWLGREGVTGAHNKEHLRNTLQRNGFQEVDGEIRGIALVKAMRSRDAQRQSLEEEVYETQTWGSAEAEGNEDACFD